MSLLKEVKKLGIKAQGKKEDTEAYLVRVHESIAKLDENKWNELSDPMQTWFNKSANALNENKDLFPLGAKDSSSDPKEEDNSSDEDTGKEAISYGDLKKGMEVALTDKKGKALAEGEVIKVTDIKVTIDDTNNGKITVMEKKIATVTEIPDGVGADDAPKSSASDSGDEEDMVELDMADIAKGRDVSLYDAGDEVLVEGEVVKKLKLSIIVKDGDGEETTIKLDKVDSVWGFADAPEAKAEDSKLNWVKTTLAAVKKGDAVLLESDVPKKITDGIVKKVSKTSIKIKGSGKYAATDFKTIYTAGVAVPSGTKKNISSKKASSSNKASGVKVEDLVKGDTVTITKTNDETVSGEVTGIFSRNGDIKAVFVDGNRLGVSKIASIAKDGAASSDSGDDKGKSEKKGDSKPKAELIVEGEIVKYPKLSIEKITARVNKNNDINDVTIKITFDNVHRIIDSLVAAGKMPK